VRQHRYDLRVRDLYLHAVGDPDHYPDRHADRYTDGHRDQHSDQYRDCHRDGHGDRNADCNSYHHGHRNQYGDGDSERDADGHPNQNSERHSDSHSHTQRRQLHDVGRVPIAVVRRRHLRARAQSSPGHLATRPRCGARCPGGPGRLGLEAVAAPHPIVAHADAPASSPRANMSG
jgi:hypothetical protein